MNVDWQHVRWRCSCSEEDNKFVINHQCRIVHRCDVDRSSILRVMLGEKSAEAKKMTIFKRLLLRIRRWWWRWRWRRRIHADQGELLGENKIIIIEKCSMYFRSLGAETGWEILSNNSTIYILGCSFYFESDLKINFRYFLRSNSDFFTLIFQKSKWISLRCKS